MKGESTVPRYAIFMMIQHGPNMDNILKHITEEAQKRGHDVRIRDIAYALMKVKFNDSLIAYTVAFGVPDKDNDVTAYESLPSTKYLVKWFEKDLKPKEVEKKSNEDIVKALTKAKKTEADDDGSMSFEENRAGIEKQIAEVLELKQQLIGEDGICTDVKTMAMLQKTEMDARSRLNDKFGAAEKSNEQYIIVQPKYNHICEWTHRECWLMTEEWAKKHYHLIKDPNYKE